MAERINTSGATAKEIAQAIGEVLKVNPFFGKAKKREEKWNEIKAKYFNLEGEIEID